MIQSLDAYGYAFLHNIFAGLVLALPSGSGYSGVTTADQSTAEIETTDLEKDNDKVQPYCRSRRFSGDSDQLFPGPRRSPGCKRDRLGAACDRRDDSPPAHGPVRRQYEIKERNIPCPTTAQPIYPRWWVFW